jgi:hypothetical protein
MTFIPDQQNFGKGMWIDRFAPARVQIVIQQVGGGGSGSSERTDFVEVPNGVLLSFTLPTVPSALNLQVYRNGQLLDAPGDYTLVGAVCTFGFAPATGDVIVAYYGGGTSRQLVSGVRNGTNKVFTLPSAPASTSLQFFWNGLLQHEGVSDDYVLSGNQITMTLAPGATDSLVAYF